MLAKTADRTKAIEQLTRLVRVERALDRPERDDVAAVGEFLRDLIGPTVRPSEAARLLGVSHAALSRWLDRGEISAVLAPNGRREIPLSELLDLLGELGQLDGTEREGRPLARVMRGRNRRANETVDIDRLLPRRRSRGHRLAELQSLAYHRVIAERLDERLVAEAVRRIARQREGGRIHPKWGDEWDDVLRQPIPRIAQIISSDTEHARELRQTSPFAGVLTEQERRRLVRGVRDRFGS